jgi:putative NADH-flavin reductase
MNVVVFGASGGTGREVVKQALARGHGVTAFGRHPEKVGITHPNLRGVRGDVAEPEAVAAAVAGQEAVVSTLGVGIPLKHDPAVIAGVRHILRAMEAASVRRLIYQSFIGVRESRAGAGLLLRYVAVIPLRHEIADHEVKEEMIKSSGMDWTIVRPPKLTDGGYTGAYRVGEGIVARSVFPTLSRADVAAFMVGQLTDAASVRKALTILP